MSHLYHSKLSLQNYQSKITIFGGWITIFWWFTRPLKMWCREYPPRRGGEKMVAVQPLSQKFVHRHGKSRGNHGKCSIIYNPSIGCDFWWWLNFIYILFHVYHIIVLSQQSSGVLQIVPPIRILGLNSMVGSQKIMWKICSLNVAWPRIFGREYGRIMIKHEMNR